MWPDSRKCKIFTILSIMIEDKMAENQIRNILFCYIGYNTYNFPLRVSSTKFSRIKTHNASFMVNLILKMNELILKMS